MIANSRLLMVTALVLVATLVAFSGQRVIAGDKLNFIDAPGSPIELTDSWSAAIGDFNEDGHLDIAVLCPLYYSPDGYSYVEGGAAAVAILLGNGDGTFGKPEFFPVGNGSWNSLGIARGDFNSDGHLDLVVTNPGTGHEDVGSVGVFLLEGDGKGNFQQVGFAPTSFYPTKMAVADFDRDGNLDVAVACSNSIFGHRVSMLFGDGRGKFERHDIMFPVGIAASDVATADFNKDGWADLAVPGGNIVFVLLADPHRSRAEWFSRRDEYQLSYPTDSLAPSDFDNDGDTDLVIWGRHHLVSMTNAGQGDFTMRVVVYLPDVYISFYTLVADINMDGNLDIVLLDKGQVWLYLGDGEGNFRRPIWSLFSVQWQELEASLSNVKDYPIEVPESVRRIFNNYGSRLSASAIIQLIQENLWEIIDRRVVYLLQRDGETLDVYGSSSLLIPQCTKCRRGIFWDATWLGAADFNEDGWPDLALRATEIGVFSGIVIQLNRGG